MRRDFAKHDRFALKKQLQIDVLIRMQFNLNCCLLYVILSRPDRACPSVDSRTVAGPCWYRDFRRVSANKVDGLGGGGDDAGIIDCRAARRNQTCANRNCGCGGFFCCVDSSMQLSSIVC